MYIESSIIYLENLTCQVGMEDFWAPKCPRQGLERDPPHRHWQDGQKGDPEQIGSRFGCGQSWSRNGWLLMWCTIRVRVYIYTYTYVSVRNCKEFNR